LASFVRQAQLKRKMDKGNSEGKKYWWSVRNPGNSNAGIEVIATNKEEAIDKAIGPDGYPSWANNRSSLAVKPLRPYVEEKISYEIFNLNTNRSIEYADGITNDRDALIRLDDYIHHGPHSLQPGQARNMFGIRRIGDSEPILAQPIRATQPVRPAVSPTPGGGEWTGWWLIKDANGAGLHRFNGVGNNQADANRVALRWLIDNGYGHGHEVSVVPEMS